MAYTGKDIQVLEGLEPVRKRPGMYIGGTGTPGLHHMLWEVVDNAVDEATNGYASQIDVTLHADGQSVTVSDNGRGIPVDVHPEKGVSTLELILTTLHAGGKFDGSSYITSGGLHGVGASVVNALSDELVATVTRDGATTEQRYARGTPLADAAVVNASARGSGTTIFFRPDAEIFETVDFDPLVIRENLEVKTYLNRDLKIVFTDETEGERYVYHHEGGIAEYLAQMVGDLGVRPSTRTRSCCEDGRPRRRRTPRNRPSVDGRAQRAPAHLCERHPHTRRRHARVGPEGRRARGRARLHGHARPRPAPPRPYGRRHARGARGHREPLPRRPAVSGADEGQAQQPRGPLARRGHAAHGARTVPERPPLDRRGHRRARHPSRQGAAREPQRRQPRAHLVQPHAPPQPAGQARRLLLVRARRDGALHRRGRLGGRLGQAGARPRHAGRPAAAGQGPQRRAGHAPTRAEQQGAFEHRAGPRLRPRPRPRPPKPALPQGHPPDGRRLGRPSHRDAPPHVLSTAT